MNPSKPGIFTTEFLFTLIGQGVGFLALSGKIAPEHADTITQGLVTIVGGLIAIYSGIAYIWSRTKIKQTIIEGQQQEIVMPTEQNTPLTPIQ